MNQLTTALLTALLTAAACPLHAASRLCANGQPPRLSGDLFSPVECSTTTKPSPALPDLPLRPSKESRSDLRDLDGRWEGTLIHALGRYALLMTIKTNWNGRTELVLNTKEQQFRERLTDRLALIPAKERGSYEAVMTTTLAPDASLKGGVLIGAAAEPGVTISTRSAKVPAERQLDVLFVNGASHRVIFLVKGKDELHLRAFSAIPGAPLQSFETTLKRTKRESL